MRAARWVLNRLAPAEWRESLEGDLLEERARRRATGRPSGALWSVAAALTLVIALRKEARASHPTRGRGHLGDGIWQDVRMSVRALRAAPGFTAVAVFVLALGIGAGTAIFSVVDAVLLRDLPFERADRLVAVGEKDRNRPVPAWFVGSAASQNYRDWLDMLTVFESIAASVGGRGFTVRDSGEPEDLTAIRATASLFDVLRVRPQRGQAFTADNETEGRDRVLLISDSLWRRRFDADPGIVGKTMTFDSGVWQIVGVLPAHFAYPVSALKPTDIVAPYAPTARERIRDRNQTGRTYSLRVVGRLKDGTTMEQVRREMERITSALEAKYPDWFEDRTWAAAPLHEATVGRTRNWMVLLLGAVGCVLLIACANVANLMLVRAANRSREMSVRAALGASRWRIARSLLVESLVLSIAGLAVALLIALWGVSVLRASIPDDLPRLATVGLDLRVLLVAAMAAVVTGLLCGVIPALQLSRPNLQASLRDGGRSATGGRMKHRVRSALVVAEVALAVMLVVGAGLFVSSFIRLVTVDLGIDHRDVLSTNVNPRITQLDDAGLADARARSTTALADVMARVQALPGVEAAAAVAGGSPLSGSYKTNLLAVVGGREFTREEDQVQIQEVSPGYFDVVRQPLRRGRVIDGRDGAGAPAVAVVNEEAAARYFAGADPVGQRIAIDKVERVVIGVVGNVHLVGPEEPISPGVYFALAQEPSIGASVLTRTRDTSGATASAIRAAVLASVPGVPVHQESLEESLRAQTEQRRFNMLLVGAFGALALVIASAGIYGVMAYAVAQQTQEIGVRMALGAMPHRVMAMVLGRASVVMLGGLLLGLAGAWAAAGLVQSFLFGVTPHDPVVFAAAGGLLVFTGLLAALVPALRAARVDPIVALRHDG
ncbi:MAG TPA: ABC transporter permease [Vicinamibacterales bacterium]|nr:ABC transporter permease [Vicinamibacterales bacterium]